MHTCAKCSPHADACHHDYVSGGDSLDAGESSVAQDAAYAMVGSQAVQDSLMCKELNDGSGLTGGRKGTFDARRVFGNGMAGDEDAQQPALAAVTLSPCLHDTALTHEERIAMSTELPGTLVPSNAVDTYNSDPLSLRFLHSHTHGAGCGHPVIVHEVNLHLFSS